MGTARSFDVLFLIIAPDINLNSGFFAAKREFWSFREMIVWMNVRRKKCNKCNIVAQE